MAETPPTELGRTYRDKVTGFEGIATHATRFLYACERVCLVSESKDGDVKELVCDAPQLELVKGGRRVDPQPEPKTGGDRPSASRARGLSR